ncbi:MAG: hypothetical protein LBI95_02560 [Holosporales bacterium]|nr:hypothetical protein [Holosporales bacterium]
MVYGLSRLGRRIHVMFEAGWFKLLSDCSTWNILCLRLVRWLSLYKGTLWC